MSKDTGSPASRTSANDEARRVRRLERRLAAVRELEAKRSRQAAKARDHSGARHLQAKRQRQLEQARSRGVALEAELATLSPTEPAAPAAGPSAYCLREKQIVAMVDPTPIVMRNGRTGTTGTCPSCGARVSRPA